MAAELAARADLSLISLADVDAREVLALNQAHAVETSSLDTASYGRLLMAAGFAVALGERSRPDAFIIAFSEVSRHPNDNLAWFRSRHARFYYVDRVIVAPHARGRGLARRLYGALFDLARSEGRPLVGCEINVTPPNPGSDALHEALGFIELERRDTAPGKVIRYMRKML
jgi:predicted GNAT superfamily acetyltransferase